MILVSMERGEPTLYYGTKQLYFGCVNFKFTGGGNHPLRKTTVNTGIVNFMSQQTQQPTLPISSKSLHAVKTDFDNLQKEGSKQLI